MKPTEQIQIERARPEDGAVIAALLRTADLPSEDFAAHLARFFVARKDGVVVGAVGAEVCGADALLRSLVVAPAWRGAGLGGRLVDELGRAATAWGVGRWWLLTTTAEAFFAKRGFVAVPRANAPAALARTEEFQSLCPASAVCMMRAREGGGA